MARFHLTDTVEVHGTRVDVSTIQLEPVATDCHGAVTLIDLDRFETCLFWSGLSRVVDTYSSARDAITGHARYCDADTLANVLVHELPAPVPATVRETLLEAYGADALKHSSYVYSIENSYRTDYSDVLVVSHAVRNDIHGYDDAVGVSNFETLLDSWGSLEAWFDSTYSNADYAGLRLDATAPGDLIEVLDALENYPCLDDSRYSEVEDRMIREDYESYGRYDVLETVATAIGFTRADLTDVAVETIDRLVWDGLVDYGYSDGYPTRIDSSAVDFGYKEIAEYVRARVGTIVTAQRRSWEDPTVIDLRLETLIEAYARV